MVTSDATLGPDWDGHLLLLHDTEAERLAGLTAWARRGLERDEKVIYTETPNLPPAQSFLGVLETTASTWPPRPPRAAWRCCRWPSSTRPKGR